MKTPMRCLVVAVSVVLLLLDSRPARGQLVVHDPAVTGRNSLTAVLKEYLLDTQRAQHRQLRRMARRLSVHTGLDKYAPADPPRWRTHGSDVLFSRAYNEALIFGDPEGAAYRDLVHPVRADPNRVDRLTPAARRVLTSRLATVDVADATAMVATHDTGQLRFNGRKRERVAIDALEAHVTDPSNEQSAAAVLEKISGAALIGVRQRQARVQLLAGIVEQLLVDSKRARDSETEAINMQVVMWRDARTANKAFVAGTADALRTWRQP
jgi:hypothetical protein